MYLLIFCEFLSPFQKQGAGGMETGDEEVWGAHGGPPRGPEEGARKIPEEEYQRHSWGDGS